MPRPFAIALLFLIGCTGGSVAQNVLERNAASPDRPGVMSIRWLGAAGFEIRTQDGILLTDPYLTRASLSTLGFGRLQSDEALLRRVFPRADAILIGHSHFDHLLDAPTVGRLTNARLYASRDACRIAAHLEPESDCRSVRSSTPQTVAGFSVFAIPAHHGRALFGVPIDGETQRIRPRHPHMLDLRVGQTLIWIIESQGIRVAFVSTAGLPIDPLAFSKRLPEGVDVLLMALALRENTPGYVRHLLDTLRPRVVIPHHPGLPTFELTDPLPEDMSEAFSRFAKEEGEVVRIPRPFTSILIEADPAPRG